MHTFRLYRYRGRDVIAIETGDDIWKVRFVEYDNVLQHVALVDPREIQPTPFTVPRVRADGRRIGSIEMEARVAS